MNILQALASGRPFRAKHFVEGWHWCMTDDRLVVYGPRPQSNWPVVTLTVTDVLAEYTPYNVTVEMSENAFRAAVEQLAACPELLEPIIKVIFGANK